MIIQLRPCALYDSSVNICASPIWHSTCKAFSRARISAVWARRCHAAANPVARVKSAGRIDAVPVQRHHVWRICCISNEDRGGPRRQARVTVALAFEGASGSAGRTESTSTRKRQTLSAAQLAIACEYGFAIWPKLRGEVLRRQAGTEPDAGAETAPGPEIGSASESAPKSWQQMRQWCARLLRARTGQGVAAWNERIAAGPAQNRADEQALRVRSRSTTEVRCRRGARPLGRTDGGPWRSVVGTAR
jgi:hypothetical protein